MPKGIKGFQKGQKFTEKHKEKLRISHLGKKHTKEHNEKIRLSNSGEHGNNWKGGKDIYLKRQAKIRDNYICQICGFSEIEIMEVDHIKPKSKYPELSYCLENLITICPNCHARKTKRERKNKLYK